MWKSTFLKASFAVGMLLLCVAVPIVGAGGPIWIAWTSPTTNSLYSVHMASMYDGWAVGDSATMIHWNGADWSNATPSRTDANYRSVFMLGTDDVWAVGYRTVYQYPIFSVYPVIGHWDGFSWSNVTCPSTGSLWSVYMLSASDGWAVGASGPSVVTNAKIVHWDGTSWSSVTSPTKKFLYAVYMVGTSDGWAVGSSGTIIHWDGITWSNSTSHTTEDLNSVFALATDNMWVVGSNGVILHWNGADWNYVASHTTETLQSVYMVSPTDGWAMGTDGVIIRWNGYSWSTVTTPTSMALMSVFMGTADYGWAVGQDGTIIEWNGSEWIPESSTSMYMPVLISLTLVAVVLAKTVSKKRRSPSILNKT